MTDSVKWIDPWSDWATGARAVLRSTRDPAERASGLAGLLARIAPAGSASGCLLVGVVGQVGPGFPTDLQGCCPEPGRLERDSAPPGNILAVGVARIGGASCGLFLGLPEDCPEEVVGGLAVLLGLGGALLGEILRSEEVAVECQELQDLAMAGEAALGMTHALNNHLNSMILQAMAVQIRLSDPLRTDLGNVRKEGMQAAARLRPLQALRDEIQPPAEQASMAGVVRDLAQEEPDLPLLMAGPIDPAIRLPMTVSHLRLLLRLLLRLVQEGQQDSAPASLRAVALDNGSALHLSMPGWNAPAEGGDRLIDLEMPLASGLLELRLAAIQGLVRRLGGAIAVEKQVGGTQISLHWSADSPRLS